MYHFLARIAEMNSTFELDAIQPTGQTDRLVKFKDILEEECAEINSVLATIANPQTLIRGLDARVMLADLLGDIIVYCASEALRWNIPIEEVLTTIMDSNFSKLGNDGKPIKDARGKFLKGPNYWKPEPSIATLLAHFPLGEDRSVDFSVTAAPGSQMNLSADSDNQ